MKRQLKLTDSFRPTKKLKLNSSRKSQKSATVELLNYNFDSDTGSSDDEDFNPMEQYDSDFSNDDHESDKQDIDDDANDSPEKEDEEIKQEEETESESEEEEEKLDLSLFPEGFDPHTEPTIIAESKAKALFKETAKHIKHLQREHDELDTALKNVKTEYIKLRQENEANRTQLAAWYNGLASVFKTVYEQAIENMIAKAAGHVGNKCGNIRNEALAAEHVISFVKTVAADVRRQREGQ